MSTHAQSHLIDSVLWWVVNIHLQWIEHHNTPDIVEECLAPIALECLVYNEIASTGECSAIKVCSEFCRFIFDYVLL